jgi:hypothetical protein
LVKSNFAESRQEERADETSAFAGMEARSNRASFIAREDWTRYALRERYSSGSTSISKFDLDQKKTQDRNENRERS